MGKICEINDIPITRAGEPETPIETTEGFDRRYLLTPTSPAKYRILRTLIGSVTIKHLATNTSFEQNIDYISKSYASESESTIHQRLVSYISDDITLTDAAPYFFDIPYSLRNKDFFQRLENEINNYLYYQSKLSFTTAYVFIYRILEMISFSFPMIYAAKTSDFKHTYGTLKDYFGENKGNSGGELGFLKSAVQSIFKDHDLSESSVDIILDYHSEEEQRQIYSAIMGVTKADLYHGDTLENRKIAIKFTEVSSFIVNIRNRFFHLFNRGDKNFDSIDIIDADLLFSKLNEPLFGWLAIVFLEVVRFTYTEVN